MSNSTIVQKLHDLREILSSSTEFTVTTSRTLLATNMTENLEGRLTAILLPFEKDIDGFVVKLRDWLGPGLSILWVDWLTQDLDIENVEKKLVFIQLNGDFVLADNGAILHSSKVDFEKDVWSKITYYRVLKALANEGVSDHHNQARRELVFYSSTRGVIKLKYLSDAPIGLNTSVDNLNELITRIELPNYKIYFINCLFDVAGNKESVELHVVLSETNDVLAKIKRNYELALKQFDFEKFKDSLLKEKDKYFSTIREIVSKVYSQLIGIPISISASAFATYKVADEPYTLLLIALGFTFYVVLYIKIQFSYKRDLNDLRTDFARDFAIIKEKSGLELVAIAAEERKVLDKITDTIFMIKLMIGGILILGCSFLLYLSSQYLEEILNIRLLFNLFYKLIAH